MKNYTKEPITYADARLATKKYAEYLKSTTCELSQAYGRYSPAKLKAWNYCKELMWDLQGHGLKIISHNGYQFTAGFMFEENGKEMFMYISKAHDIAVEVA